MNVSFLFEYVINTSVVEERDTLSAGIRPQLTPLNG